MFYVVTACSRPNNLPKIYHTIPKEAKWIICYDGKNGMLPFLPNAIIMNCEDTGFVGAKAKNYVLDYYPFNDEDIILYHDDDNIIHESLYSVISPLFGTEFSIMCWGQLNKDGSIRLHPSIKPKPQQIDTACYAIKWKFNRNTRNRTDIYEYDGFYAEDCSKNGPTITINDYLCYYNAIKDVAVPI